MRCGQVFTLKVPYPQRFQGEVVVGVTGLIIFGMLVSGTHRDNVIFVYLMMIFFWGIAVVINYMNERVYILDEGSESYSFIVGKKTATGTYHNIYIRLSKVKVIEKLRKDPAPARYHLVLDGVKIDRKEITKKSSTDIKALRKYVSAHSQFCLFLFY